MARGVMLTRTNKVVDDEVIYSSNESNFITLTGIMPFQAALQFCCTNFRRISTLELKAFNYTSFLEFYMEFTHADLTE